MKLKITFLAFAFLPLAGCFHMSSDPIRVEPIHIIMDVNVKVDKALDDFFGDIDKKSTTITSPSEAESSTGDTAQS